jgi:antitoxin PrlF
MPTFEVRLTRRGQVTIPAKLGVLLRLKPGDALEFYFGASNQLMVRPRNLPASAVFENAPKGRPSRNMTDDEAIAEAVLQKDRRSRSRRRIS